MDVVSACVFVLFVLCMGMVSGVWLADILNDNKSKTDKKPIIRHCKNCNWCRESLYDGYCTVKYQHIDWGRPKALFCRFYKKKEGGKDESKV